MRHEELPNRHVRNWRPRERAKRDEKEQPRDEEVLGTGSGEGIFFILRGTLRLGVTGSKHRKEPEGRTAVQNTIQCSPCHR